MEFANWSIISLLSSQEVTQVAWEQSSSSGEYQEDFIIRFPSMEYDLCHHPYVDHPPVNYRYFLRLYLDL